MNPSSDNTISWQTVIKRKFTFLSTEVIENSSIETQNRFSFLPVEPEDNTAKTIQRIPRPPPIFIQGVTNFSEMSKNLTTVINDEQFYTKTLAKNNVKVNVTNPDAYRTLVRSHQKPSEAAGTSHSRSNLLRNDDHSFIRPQIHDDTINKPEPDYTKSADNNDHQTQIKMAKFIRLATWNANGLPKHKYELTTFMTLKKIGVMLISETHFT
ncbi:hypothetical protein WA026_008503 [Henosepilachna vigintioctopunctata]|uniref:Uncharacterized protein n=1 Tax=Henosepilachna vigintioctopunctata TaxID=420089 RepID=A0AAW1UG10_9CUCU